MLRIGLTGGIGAGKTTVSRLFQALGAPVVDADDIARQLLEPGQAGYQAVVAAFGEHLLDQQGYIDRARLRHHVFADSAQRRRLEALLHPLVFAGLAQAAAAHCRDPYCVFAVPLLVETGYQTEVDRVLVVDVPEAVQYRRVQQRDGVDAAQVQAILAAQCDRATRLAVADDVICNCADPANLEQHVHALHQRYLLIAAGRSPNKHDKTKKPTGGADKGLSF